MAGTSAKPWLNAFLVLLACFNLSAAGDVESITMTAAPGYTNLRDCAKYCFHENGRGNIFGLLSCSENNCLCRADLVSEAHSAISSCIYTQQCQTTNTVDLSLGVSFYDAYCSSYHYELTAPVTVTASATSDPTTTASSRSTVTVTITSSPSNTGISSKPPLSAAFSALLAAIGIIALST